MGRKWLKGDTVGSRRGRNEAEGKAGSKDSKWVKRRISNKETEVRNNNRRHRGGNVRGCLRLMKKWGSSRRRKVQNVAALEIRRLHVLSLSAVVWARPDDMLLQTPTTQIPFSARVVILQG